MAKKTLKKTEYNYTAKDGNGDKVKGVIFAQSAPLAKTMLKKKGLTKIAVAKPIKLFQGSGKKKVSGEDITMFTRQMSTMIFSGIPLVQAFDVLAEGLEKDGLKRVVNEIKQEVESGSTFSGALEKQPEIFDELYCSLVDAGEQSGSLDVMMDRIATYKEKTDSLKRKIKKAMFYPAAIVFIASIVTVVLLLKVVPTFKELFAGFGAELPAFTQMVLTVSAFVENYGFYIAIVLGVGGWSIAKLYKMNTAFRNKVQTVGH